MSISSILAIFLLSLTPTLAQTVYPDMANISRPSPEPTFPAGFDTFQPPVSSNSPATGSPTIAEWTRIGTPGSLLALTGDKLSTHTGTTEGTDTLFQVFGQSANGSVTASATKLRLDGVKAALELPENLPANGEYLIWPVNSVGVGRPVAVNATEAWWVGPNLATRGDTVSIYGRNLAHQGTSATSHVYIQQSGLPGVWATVTAANPYKVDFTVPANLVNGDYQVWIHNGHGGHYGWSGPQTLTINDGLHWTSQTFNVKSYGAKGNGIADDEAAIQATLIAASKVPWSTIYIPAGTYMVSRGFTPPAQVRWLGDGPKKTFIKANTGFVKPATYDGRRYSLLFGNANQIIFQDFTLDTNDHLNGYLGTPVQMRGSHDVHFINVTIKANNYTVADFHSSNLVTFKNCDLIGGNNISAGVFFGSAVEVLIDGCRVYGSNDVNTMLTWWGGDRMSCINTTAQDYDNTKPDGWAQGRFFYGASTWGSNRNIYIGDNTTRALSVRPGFGNQNTGEQCLWENQTYYSGTPTSATATTVTFPATSNVAGIFNPAYDLVVVSGTGLGQHRKIVSSTGTTATITPAWNVPPDNTSTVIVAGVTSRCAIYHNTFQGKSDYLTRSTASCAVEPFGNSYDFIIDGNDISQMRCGISIFAVQESTLTPNSLQSAYFNYTSNNVIHGCYAGIRDCAAQWTPWPANNPNPGTFNLGNSYTNNNLNNIATSGISETGISKLGDQFNLNMFDVNTFTSVATDYDLSSASNNEVVEMDENATTAVTAVAGTSSSSNSSSSTSGSSTTSSGTTATTPGATPNLRSRPTKPVQTQTTKPTTSAHGRR